MLDLHQFPYFFLGIPAACMGVSMDLQSKPNLAWRQCVQPLRSLHSAPAATTFSPWGRCVQPLALILDDSLSLIPIAGTNSFCVLLFLLRGVAQFAFVTL